MNLVIKKSILTSESKHLIKKNDRIIIAVSGGADSVALLDILVVLLKKYNLCLAIAHYDHGLRESSFSEALMVANLAKKYDLPFYTSSENLLKYKKESIEERARTMRYHFLEKCATKFNANSIAVAHHANDQAETLLLNLMRGSGIVGLAGIPYQRNISLHSKINIIRPLLDLQKSELLEYLTSKNIEWTEDISNKDIAFERNKVRQILLPFMKENFQEKIISSLQRTSIRCQEVVLFMDEQIENTYKNATTPLCSKENIQNILKLQDCFVEIFDSHMFDNISGAMMPFFMRIVMNKLREGSSIRNYHYQMIEKLKTQKSGKICFSNNVVMLKKSNKIYMYKTSEKKQYFKILSTEPTKIKKLLISVSEEENNESFLTQKFDPKKVNFPLQIRPWTNKDFMKPLGFFGQKKVSKILKDIKLYTPFRDYIPLVVDSNDKPVWLIGICIDHNVRISETTKNKMYLSIIEN